MRLACRTYVALAAIALAMPACVPDGFEEVEEDADQPAGGKADAAAGPMVVVEIGDDFVELRNDGAVPVDLDGWYLSFSRRRVRLEPRSGREHIVAPGGLAIIVSPDTEVPARVSAWMPVVDASKSIAELLDHSKSLILRTPDKIVADRIDARDVAITGVSVERRLKTRVSLSDLGATPGERNAIHDDGAIRALFADPLGADSTHLGDELAAFITWADHSIDAALYQLDHPAVIDALVAAASRGVAVRLATDTHYYEDPAYAAGYEALEAAGIPIVDDRRSARQHNKFIVVDGARTWVGSFNPVVENKADIQFDDAVIIESADVASMFAAELDEMFAGNFGPWKTDSGIHTAHVDGARVDVYFSPTDSPIDAIVAELGRARSNIYFAQFAFYATAASEVMLERRENGVDVRGVFDRRSANAVSRYATLADAGVDVRRPYFDAFVHHKFVIVDYGTADPVVITGSYNLSNKAETANDESVVIIHDRHVAEAYYRVWSRMYAATSGPNTDTDDLVPVVVSEVYAGAPGDGSAAFVELVNVGDTTVDLSDLVLGDRDGTFVDLSGTVSPGQRVVVDASDLALEFSDPVVVFDAWDRIVTTFDSPGFAGPGRSMQRSDLTTPDIDAEWTPSAEIGGTPGW
jgi:phosphatidylserine/phosphatidylglycerophosphate/cardiolipin synthase-like enzyme